MNCLQDTDKTYNADFYGFQKSLLTSIRNICVISVAFLLLKN
jgi:hypothetical protein